MESRDASMHLWLGTVAGMVANTANYPLLTWKNARQQNLPLQVNLSVYRGLTLSVLNQGSNIGLQFWGTAYFQRALYAGKLVSPSEQMTACFFGGVFSGIPCSVLELTMIQQQRFGGSIASTPPRVMRKFGAHMILRGMICTIVRESAVSMAMLGVTPLAQQTLVDDFGIDSNIGLAAGALLGSMFSTTVSHPFDTIKTCMQGDCEQAKYTNIRGTGQTLVNEFGVRKGLFKALGWRISFAGTTFFLVHKFKEAVAPNLFLHDAPKNE
eukprot:TRINITY_DN6651_c0_g1_i1.p1 TRINITY_DN6651_c0_g1~~TRINITY_DN6651_c0_g1_i1.p1  ORF type:complete len:268 (-),score=32.80 TRINITY_DN6651_c0_g1_i1:322-1125(-)